MYVVLFLYPTFVMAGAKLTMVVVSAQVKAVPAAVKRDITALDLKFAELRKELIQDAQSRIQTLELKNDVLEKELKELKDAADATSFALLPVNFALEVREALVTMTATTRSHSWVLFLSSALSPATSPR